MRNIDSQSARTTELRSAETNTAEQSRADPTGQRPVFHYRS